MGFWAKSLLVFQCLGDYRKQGVRRIAQQTGRSKSSVHRLKQAIERRDVYPDSWFWETAAGRSWLRRLVVATLYTLWVEARRWDGPDKRVLDSSPSGKAGRVFALGPTRYDGGPSRRA
jgi:hypothetical protein